MTDHQESQKAAARIVIMPNGSLHVFGDVPLVHKTQVVSEYGEPLTWIKDMEYEVKKKEGKEYYSLCRCGKSKVEPFCDGTHRDIAFDGTETADTLPMKTRSIRLPHSTRIIVMKDPSLCSLSGFCGLRDASMEQLVAATEEPRVRSLVMAMIERCPSGALTYRIEENDPNIEPDLPVQIAVTTEITSDGPIQGPFWVTGKIPIERSDGKPFETRNRVVLCNCGESCQKPLCDGTHRALAERSIERERTQNQ